MTMYGNKVTNGVEGQNSLDDAKVSTFNFQVPGKFAAKTSYQVLYLGKNATSGKVTLSATQKQTEPNQTLHLGESGDVGHCNCKQNRCRCVLFPSKPQIYSSCFSAILTQQLHCKAV